MPANSSAVCMQETSEISADATGLATEAEVMLVQGSMVALAFLSVKLVSKYKIPLMTESGSVILSGFIMGAVLHVWDKRFGKAAAMFNSNAFFLLLLPPIIFDAGFNLTSSKSSLSSNAGTILLLAIFGTIISTVIVGLILYLGFGLVSDRDFSLWESFAFGSLISAVDPVATLAVLQEVFPSAKPAMFYLVFGESVINDAVSIVLYTVCEHVIENEQKSTSVDSSVAGKTASVFAVFLHFWGLFIGSMVVGVIVALLTALFLKVTDLHLHPTTELVTVLFSAFGMYSIAESLELSGIMAIFVGGRLVKHWVLHNLSVANKIFIPRLTRALAETAELYVFAFLGAAFWAYSKCLVWDVWFIVLTFIAILVGRAANVFPLCFLSNRFRDHTGEKITFPEQIFMWFSGLRGAIAFALACYGSGNGILKNGDLLVTTTLVIVLATVFIFGGLAKPLLKSLNLAPTTARRSEAPIPGREGEAFLRSRPPPGGGDAPPARGAIQEDDEEDDVFASGVGATFGPPPQFADSDSQGCMGKCWRAFRYKIWQCVTWCLSIDTRYIKPFVCFDAPAIDRKRERIVQSLLREGVEHEVYLYNLAKKAPRRQRTPGTGPGISSQVPEGGSEPESSIPTAKLRLPSSDQELVMRRTSSSDFATGSRTSSSRVRSGSAGQIGRSAGGAGNPMLGGSPSSVSVDVASLAPPQQQQPRLPQSESSYRGGDDSDIVAAASLESHQHRHNSGSLELRENAAKKEE
ncbi:Sodium/hydrogen exchanger 1 [Diplonema papillatum]|nr:Sodium/hydrogen exchanger 1 [Diplonema papillatum]|eukprot:gene16352-25066_t